MYYGWFIVTGALISQLFVTGFMTYAFSTLVIPIQETFGVGREQVMLGFSVSALIGLVLSPIVGVLVDRFPARGLMAFGAASYGLGLLALAQVDSITVFIPLYGITLSLANLLMGPLVTTTSVSRWFLENRARALGVTALGTSLGGIVVPELFSIWLQDGTWRDCLHNLGLMILAVVLPYALFVMREPPSVVSPVEAETPESSAYNDNSVASVADDAPGLLQILRNRQFWLISLALGSMIAVYSGLMNNLAPFAREVGGSDDQGVRLIMLVAIGGFVGKLGFGFAADKIQLRIAFWSALALLLVTQLLFWSAWSFNWVLLGGLLMGLAAGGLLPVWGALIAAVFGLGSYGRVMGLMNNVVALFAIGSPFYAAYVAEHSGSYQSVFPVYALMLVISALFLIPVKRV